MSVTKEDLEKMQRDLNTAMLSYNRDKSARQKAVIGELQDYKKQIEALVKQAEALADSVDLRFYFHTGYDEFEWVDAEIWSSSSMHC